MTATRREMGVILAAARMTHDLVAADPHAPQVARERLSIVLREFDAALRAAPDSRHASRQKGHAPCM